ncbi:DUF421 domain-containing protein [Utexia brackfieldae]|uniref:DUF421 domain-containing protein n=1 Tax=Utexia brackfieldae TaxID=3074108 RepID=UPI00370D29A0
MVYLHIAAKLILAFVFVIIVLRVTGKSSMSQMTVIDVIGNMILGSIVGGIIYNGDIGMVHFLMILIIWTLIMMAVYYLQMLSNRAKQLIVGKPVELIRDNQLILSALSYCKLDISDLNTLLRMKGINSLTEVYHAQLEPNGQLSVIKNGEVDFGYIVVKNGQIDEDILAYTEKDKKWLEKALNKKGFSSLDNIFCVEYYDNDISVVTKQQIKETDEKAAEKKTSPATTPRKRKSTRSRSRKPANKKPDANSEGNASNKAESQADSKTQKNTQNSTQSSTSKKSATDKTTVDKPESDNKKTENKEK